MPTYQKVIWLALALTVLAILVLAYFLFLAPQAQGTPPLKTEPAVQEARPSAEPLPTAPAAEDYSPLKLDLNQSDAPVRELIAAAPVPEELREWGRQKEILRSLVAAVDNVAQGQSPAAQLAFLAPNEKFSVSETKRGVFLDPKSFRRYDALIDVFVAIPDEALLRWYRKLAPTLETAFAELGYPGISFAQRLKQACEHLDQVPLPGPEIALEKKILSYAYADGSLENLSQAQKHLLRLGARNVARIQKKLKRFASSL